MTENTDGKPEKAPRVAAEEFVVRGARVPAEAMGEDVASEEETIESSKYLPRQPRVFEEERFQFPRSYNVNRIRLLVKDPEWLFAHWDIDSRSMEELRMRVGERAVALSRVTLRVHDAVHGGSGSVLVPPGARSWYVRASPERRSYRAELGLTLPSGVFHGLAESNTVVMPPARPSSRPASRKVDVRLERLAAAGGPPGPEPVAASPPMARTPVIAEADVEQGTQAEGVSGSVLAPWSGHSVGESQIGPRMGSEIDPETDPGGASDRYRR